MPQTQQIEKQNTNESISIDKSKEFVSNLRSKYLDAHQNEGIKIIEKTRRIEARLKNLASNLQQQFGPEGANKLFQLLGDFPVNKLEDFLNYGNEFFVKFEKDIKEDLAGEISDKLKNIYITNAIDFVNASKQNFIEAQKLETNNKKAEEAKQIEAQKKEQTKTIVENKTENDKLEADKLAEKLEKYNDAKEKAKKVQEDNKDKFNTPEYRERKQKVAMELDARPDFKAKAQSLSKDGKQVSTLDLADLVMTYQVVNENNIGTQAANDFRNSYNKLDEMLNFGYSSARDFGKNNYIMSTNESYVKINQPTQVDHNIADKKVETLKSNPEYQDKIGKMAMKFFPDVFKDFDPQKITPEQQAKIDEINKKIKDTIAKQGRSEASSIYNSFIGKLFGGNFATDPLQDKANIKEDDKYLKIHEGKFEGEVSVLGKSIGMQIENGELQMTNLLKKDERTGKYEIGLEKIDEVKGVPDFKDILGKTQSVDNQAILDSLQDASDISQFESAFGKSYAKKVKESLSNQNYPSAEQIKDKVAQQTERYYLTNKLLGYFVPPNRDYRFENKVNPFVEKGQLGKESFYQYLDILRNTFYDGTNPESVSQMRIFSDNVDKLIRDKAIDPKTFFVIPNLEKTDPDKLASSGKITQFLKKEGDKFRIDVEKFNKFYQEKLPKQKN